MNFLLSGINIGFFMYMGVFLIFCFEIYSSMIGVVLFLLFLVKGVLNFE